MTGCLRVEAWRVDGRMQPTKGLRVTATRVCSVNRDAYLRTSTDVMWLTPDMVAEVFEIYSNVNWKIE